MTVHYRKILVPLDGSELAERAVNPSLRIARAMSREAQQADESPAIHLTLLRVVSTPAMVSADPALFDELVRMGSDESQAYLRSVAAELEAEGVVVETRTVTGPPAEAIVHFAEDNKVDLIVISSHGRTGGNRWVYGSVAEKVLHHAPCAVIIIRAQATVEMFANRSILVPLDGSPLAEAALAPAMALAKGVGSDVKLLRVVPMHEPAPQSVDPSSRRYGELLDEAHQSEKAAAESYLQQIYSGWPTDHVFFDVQVTGENVADAIVDYAEEQRADLIVMSSHGRSGMGRWLHGSVAEKVLQGAGCATLIIRSSDE